MSLQSFSQFGEDLMVLELFDQIGIVHPSYLDIGAYDPFIFSNTALLYKQGSHGINVEPHPERIKLFRQHRPQDINLAAGVASASGTLDYYDFGEKDVLNTFVLEEVDKSVQRHHPLVGKTSVPVVTLRDIITTHWKGRFPDFLSIDAEGLDYEILQAMTRLNAKQRPKVICAETLGYTDEPGGEVELVAIPELLIADGYKVYAKSRFNTVFYRSRL